MSEKVIINMERGDGGWLITPVVADCNWKFRDWIHGGCQYEATAFNIHRQINKDV